MGDQGNRGRQENGQDRAQRKGQDRDMRKGQDRDQRKGQDRDQRKGQDRDQRKGQDRPDPISDVMAEELPVKGSRLDIAMRTFIAVDKDGDNKASNGEIAAYNRAQGNPKAFNSAMDVTGDNKANAKDGQIIRSEVLLYRAVQKANPKNKKGMTRAELDANQNSKIEDKEAQAFAKSYDFNNDGKLSPIEAVAAAHGIGTSLENLGEILKGAGMNLTKGKDMNINAPNTGGTPKGAKPER